MTALAINNIKQLQSAKQWLHSVRTIERRKRALMHEISDLKADREAIYDTATAFYGGERVQENKISSPTQSRAILLCDKLTARLDKLLSEMELLTLESDAVRGELNDIFESGDMKVEEFEALFYFFFEGMSNEEVAEAMFYSVEMVYKLKASALKKVEAFRHSKNG